VINESADLFEPRSALRRTELEDDLVAVLGARLERLVERHRATQRAVAELREAVAARDRRIVELDAKLASMERGRAELIARIDVLLVEVETLMRAADGGADPEAAER
jgi:chromosome segregation ATPase